MDHTKSDSWIDDASFLVKASRPGFWLTSAWFYMLPMGGHFVFDSWKFWLGLFYVTFPLGLLIYGWNDIVDFETDRLNPRKGTYLFGAKATVEQLQRLSWRIAIVQAPFIAIFLWLEGPRILWWTLLLVFATAIYNGPRGGLKGRPPFEMLNQIGYLLVFVIASWLNDVPQLPRSTFLFGGLFAMHSHLFGQIMDIVPDRLSGRRTTAVLIGAVNSKLLLVIFLVAEALIVAWFSADWLMTGFSLLAAVWFMADALWLWRARLYETWQMRLFLLGWNAVALLSLPVVWWSGALTRLVR